MSQLSMTNAYQQFLLFNLATPYTTSFQMATSPQISHMPSRGCPTTAKTYDTNSSPIQRPDMYPNATYTTSKKKNAPTSFFQWVWSAIKTKMDSLTKSQPSHAIASNAELENYGHQNQHLDRLSPSKPSFISSNAIQVRPLNEVSDLKLPLSRQQTSTRSETDVEEDPSVYSEKQNGQDVEQYELDQLLHLPHGEPFRYPLRQREHPITGIPDVARLPELPARLHAALEYQIPEDAYRVW